MGAKWAGTGHIDINMVAEMKEQPLLVDMTKLEWEGELLRCPDCGRLVAELLITTSSPRPACASCAQKRKRPRRQGDMQQLELV